MAATVWLLRHGERQDSVDPDWASRADRPHDPGLTATGREQARRTARRLAGESIDAVYASPFLRTVETADIVARELGLPVALEPGLGEHLNPDWFDAAPEILTVDALADRFGSVDHTHEPRLVPTFPESGDEAADRAAEAARRLLAAGDDEPLLVGHGLTVGGVATRFLGHEDGVDAPLCGLTKLRGHEDGWQLAFSGSVSHLEG
jgi:broad specificity phosphatase PhoE